MNIWFLFDLKCKFLLFLVFFGLVIGMFLSCERKDKIMLKFYFENLLINYQFYFSYFVDFKFVIFDKKVEFYNEFVVGVENIIFYLSFLLNLQQGY